MARKLRLEYEGACYHVLNRGNYRAPVFAQDGAKASFMACLDAAATKSGWVIHAWCLMSNHFHLAVETPRANLVAGMRWLQVTFAVKFNRFRQENGHLFQGRYKSFVVEPGAALGSVCHYIHLNSVRAGLVTAEQLSSYPGSSLRWLAHPRERRSWYSPRTGLAEAGGLADTPAGRRAYVRYLGWLAEDKAEQRRQKFEAMSRGWAIGTAEFKNELKQDHAELAEALDRGFRDLDEWREEQHVRSLSMLLRCLGKTDEDVATDAKGSAWKIAIAAEMKRRTNATNAWLAQQLNMGSPFRLSRLVSAGLPLTSKNAKICRFCAKCKI